MMTFVIIIHVVTCFVLIGLVLIQRGRGSGLVESFQGVESMFGTKTNTFLTRTTTVLSTLFFITCLSLAALSVRQSRSLLMNITTKSAPVSVIPQQAQQPQQPVETQNQETSQQQKTQDVPKAK
jgi:preprotein translocase subunit SecG